MKQFLIVPNRSNLEQSLELAKKYNLGFEFNDFFSPDVLDDVEKKQEIIGTYKRHKLPTYNTVHGAFFDVIPFSEDKKIREIADLRIKQSIQVAKEIGAKAVVFHTNYDPFLNTKTYIDNWVERNAIYWGGVLKKHPDIKIYLENMFDTTPDIMEMLSEKLCQYDNYGVCWDYSHASLSKVKPKIWAERLGRYVKHIHINDNDLTSDLHLAWGDGRIDRQGFYEVYKKYMQGATILIETTSIENQYRSIELLKEEGFFDN